MGQAAKEVPRWKRRKPAPAGPSIIVKGRGARQISRDIRTLPALQQPAGQEATPGLLARTGAYRFRRHLTPVWLLLGIAALGLGAHIAHSTRATAIGVVLGVLCAAGLWLLTRHLKPFGRRSGAAMAALTVVWVPVLTLAGTAVPWPALLFASWLPLMWCWARHYRWRPDEKQDEPDTSDTELWTQTLGAKGRLAGSSLCLPSAIPSGTSYTLRLKRGDQDTSDVFGMSKKIASLYGKPVTEVYPERFPDGREHEVTLTLLRKNTLSRIRMDDGSGIDPATGLAVIGDFPDGTPAHFRFWSPRNGTEQSIVVGVKGSGKALALDTPVPTPSGWSTMGALRSGDIVYDETGKPCRVVDAWPVRYGRPCYEVEFSDGSVIVADAEHQWRVDTAQSRLSAGRVRRKPPQGAPGKSQAHKRNRPRVMTTEQMIPDLRIRRGSPAPGRHWDGYLNNYSVRVAGPLQASPADLPVAPYTLGAWLGDGTSSTGTITSADPEILMEVAAEGYDVWRVPSQSRPGSENYRVKGLVTGLRTAGVLNDKHIPVAYLRASEDQRRALLAGLLDTDGSCSKTGGAEYYSTNERLARDVRHLAATLGYKPTIRSRIARLYGKDCGTVWTVCFTTADKVFRLARKVARQNVKSGAIGEHRFVVSIRPVPSVPVRCIAVDSPDHLFLVGDTCIPTHNSYLLHLLLVKAARSSVPVVPIVLDPQQGQSLPDWRGRVPYARGVPECMLYLRAFEAGMKARSDYLADLAWTDEDGYERPGMDFYDPHLSKLPPVFMVFDEAHLVLSDPKYGPEAVRIVGNLVKLDRKAGGHLMLVSHAMLLSQLGDMTLRAMVVGGNAVALRTGENLSGGIIGLEADPKLLPRIFPDGSETHGLGYIVGADNRPDSPMRVRLVRNPRKIAMETPIAEMDDVFGNAFRAVLDAASRSGPAARPAAASAALAAVPPPEDDKPGRTASDAILAVLDHEMGRAQIILACTQVTKEWERKPFSTKALSDALGKLAGSDQIDKTGHGTYAPRRASLHAVGQSATASNGTNAG